MEGLAGRPGADNLVGVYAALADTTKAAVVAEWAGKPFSAFKPALADLAVEKIGPIAGRMRALLADPGHIDAVLADGAARAEAIAGPVLRDAYALAGLLRTRR